jgi:hypothetical protein
MGIGPSHQTVAARQILNELLRSALAIAEAYIGLNDRDRAFQWLERAANNRELHLSLKVDPIYEPLRTDRRFESLLHKMKLS